MISDYFCIIIQESCAPHEMEKKSTPQDASQPTLIVTLDVLYAAPLGFP